MKRYILILLVIAFAFSKLKAQQNTKLFPIVNNSKWGYINEKGEEVIKPQFAKAFTFSEGLAPVMVDGRYGYIDTKGDLVIKPVFDYAYNFTGGYAIVVINSTSYVIDNTGAKGFVGHKYSIVQQSGMRGKFFVKEDDKVGLVDAGGNVLIKPQFGSIKINMEYGIMIVTKEDTKDFYSRECGMVDTAGKWLVNYGEYIKIGPFYNGLALAEREGEKKDNYINPKGEVVLTEPKIQDSPVSSYINNLEYGFPCGLATAHFYTPYTAGSTSDEAYEGVIDKTGKIIFSNKNWRDVLPFSHNRAWVQTGEYRGDYILINTKGEQVGTTVYEDILPSYNSSPEKIFVDGKEVVETKEGWAVIDTNGNFLIQPNEALSDYNIEDRIGNLIVLMDDISTERKGHSYKYGFWDIKTNEIVLPRLYDIDFSGYENGLMVGIDDDELQVYINRNGKVIWKENQTQKTPKALNIDYMNRGYCYVQSSANIKDLKSPGGWGGSSNSPKPVKGEGFAKNEFQVVISTDTTYWYDNIMGYKLYIANTTNSKIELDAQDSRLYMVLQAQDSVGNWKDIEYLPSSWCGNSYHTVGLGAGQYWQVDIPKYEGVFKTKLRAKLLVKGRSEGDGKGKALYSNEIKASVNPAQFWRKPGYSPSGIMDPYNE